MESAEGAVINSEEFLKSQSEQEQFVGQQIELFMGYLKKDSRAGELAYDKEKATVAALHAKLGSIAKEHRDSYIDGIQPVFDPLKARHLESAWNLGSSRCSAHVLRYYLRASHHC